LVRIIGATRFAQSCLCSSSIMPHASESATSLSTASSSAAILCSDATPALKFTPLLVQAARVRRRLRCRDSARCSSAHCAAKPAFSRGGAPPIQNLEIRDWKGSLPSSATGRAASGESRARDRCECAWDLFRFGQLKAATHAKAAAELAALVPTSHRISRWPPRSRRPSPSTPAGRADGLNTDT
jgi:hypothetical protein